MCWGVAEADRPPVIIDRDRARNVGATLEETSQAAQESRLSRTVGTHDRHDLTGCDIEVHMIEDGGTGSGDRQVAHGERNSGWCRYLSLFDTILFSCIPDSFVVAVPDSQSSLSRMQASGCQNAEITAGGSHFVELMSGDEHRSSGGAVVLQHAAKATSSVRIQGQ